MKKRILSFLLMLVMVLSLVPTMATATAAAESEEEITADDLYVTDGLVAWWDAYDAANNDTVDVANGKWYSRVGDATATMMGGKWGVVNGGLGYALTKSEWDADTSAGSYYLDMGIDNLPELRTDDEVNQYLFPHLLVSEEPDDCCCEDDECDCGGHHH